MAIKLDMSKTYDRVKWNFLIKMMEEMRFGNKLTNWIKECIISVSYNNLINGSPINKISQTRGIRQGDPISLLLFLICMEGLSTNLMKLEYENKIEGIRV